MAAAASLRGSAWHGRLTDVSSRIGRKGSAKRIGGQEPGGEECAVRHERAAIARVYDYWLGGKDNFEADRVAAEQVVATFPDVLVVSGRAGFSAGGALPVEEAASGSSWTSAPACPAGNNTHEVAQR